MNSRRRHPIISVGHDPRLQPYPQPRRRGHTRAKLRLRACYDNGGRLDIKIVAYGRTTAISVLVAFVVAIVVACISR